MSDRATLPKDVRQHRYQIERQHDFRFAEGIWICFDKVTAVAKAKKPAK